MLSSMTLTPTLGANSVQYTHVSLGAACASAWQDMYSPLSMPIKKPIVKTTDELDHMVEQHERPRYLRRGRRSPVWIRVKRAGEEEDIVGRV